MYHTISNINKTINLQQYIDNRDGCKKIGLKSFTYTMGWYNLIDASVTFHGQPKKDIPSGYYSFQQLSDLLEEFNIVLSVGETNGIANTSSERGAKIGTQMKNMLGLRSNLINSELTYGERAIDFAIYKNLYVHLDQLNTSTNYFNGSASTVLAVVPVENKQFGDITTVRFEHPEYKRLNNGTINELKLTIRDENGKEIDNNGMPINCVLEIK